MTRQRRVAVFLALLVAIGLMSVPVQGAGATVQVAQHATLGTILTDAKGMTLYLYTQDAPGVSNCYDRCATNWPPLLVPAGQAPTAGAGLMGQLGTTTRTDGTLQVTFEGKPLYGWARDKAAGDTSGHTVGGVWYVVNPMSATVKLTQDASLGPVITDSAGMTLYMFTRDTVGMSNCYGTCETNWPPLLLKAGEQPTAPPGLGGKLGTTTRKDGSMQVTFNGMPLYYWAKDKAAGETTGHKVGGVWYVGQPGLMLDVAGHWSQAQVSGAVLATWVVGHPDGTFKPEGQVTRAEFIKMLGQSFGVATSTTAAGFSDTEAHWSGPYVNGAAAAGIVKASDYGMMKFEPDRPLIRSEAAVFVVRALKLEAQAAASVAAALRFSDGATLTADVQGYVGLAAEKGIIRGYPDNTVQGDRFITRAEAVVIVQRALAQKR